MRKLLIVLTLMSFAICGVTLAAVENIKVSGDITTSAITRNLSLGEHAGSTVDAEDFLFSQIRLRFDADLTEGVSAAIVLLNERNWGDTLVGNDNDDEIRLEQAYVQLEEFLYEPLTLIVGRQNLRYGSGLIVADPDTNQADTLCWNAGASIWTSAGDLSWHKSFDALRAVLDYAPYTIDMIYAKIDENADNLIDDRTLVGTNVAYEWASYNGLTEGYLFWADGRSGEATQINENEDYTLTLGARTQMDLNDKVTLGLEGAHQFGDYNVADEQKNRNAWATIASADYRFLNDYNAKLGVKFTYLSGNDDSTDEDYNAWDPLFEDQTPGEIINILMTNSNLMYTTLSGSMMPREDVTLGLQWTWAKLAENVDFGSSEYNPSVGSASTNTYSVTRDETEIGNEIDAFALYDYTEDVQLKLSSAWFIPGDVFKDANDSVAYSVRGALSVSF